jgi:hypothetical protein
VTSVYKDHSREPENAAFICSFPLYTGENYMHYSLMEKMWLRQVKLLPSILPPEVELLAKYEPPKYQYFRFGIEN